MKRVIFLSGSIVISREVGRWVVDRQEGRQISRQVGRQVLGRQEGRQWIGTQVGRQVGKEVGRFFMDISEKVHIFCQSSGPHDLVSQIIHFYIVLKIYFCIFYQNLLLLTTLLLYSSLSLPLTISVTCLTDPRTEVLS